MNELQRPPEVQAVLDEHLDAVERALLDAGLSRTERQAICDAIQTQAADMLESRGIVAPTAEDIRTVVAEMDPPDSYRESAVAAPSPAEPTRLHPAALWSVILPATAFLLMFLPFGPKGEAAGLTFLCTTGLIAAGLGIAAIIGIRKHPRGFRGVGFAAIGMCLLPALFMGTLAIYQWGPKLYWTATQDITQREQEIHQRRQRIAANSTLASVLETRWKSEQSGIDRGELQRQLKEVRERSSRMENQFAEHPIPPLTGWDLMLIRNRAIIEALSNTVALVPVICLSAIVPWLIYRSCQPRLEQPSA